MRRSCFCAVLILLASSPSRGDVPAITAGRGDLVFDSASPRSGDAELKRRFRASKEPPAYDLARERFLALVPEGYRQGEAWGLFVWVDASPRPNLGADWAPVLAEKKLLCVAAYDSGNARDLFDRCRLAVDAVHNMKRRFKIDPDRVYVSGVSGGGRVASMLGVAYADVFAGAFPIVGVNFYRPVMTGESNRAWLPVYQPEPEVLASAKLRNRYALLTGDKDFNRENTRRVFKDGFQAEGFRHVLYIEVPGLGHARPSAEWFARGLTFLDAHGADP